jgi:hypothetical protein
MSGRLVISSKKGYCPWNSKNLSKIRRDEREHREAQKREQDNHSKFASTSRLLALKKIRNSNEEHQQRFSLFHLEEKASIDRSNRLKDSKGEVDEDGKHIRNDGNTSNNEVQNQDDRKCPNSKLGGYSLTNPNTSDAFYLKSRPIHEPLGRKETQRIQEMDPMRYFHEPQEVLRGFSDRKVVEARRRDKYVEFSHREKRNRKSRDSTCSDDSSSSRGHKLLFKRDKHRKKKKRLHREDSHSHRHKRDSRSKGRKCNYSNDNKSSDTVTIEELRKKREEREQQERQRQNAFVGPLHNFDGVKTRKKRRWDQFHPTSI